MVDPVSFGALRPIGQGRVAIAKDEAAQARTDMQTYTPAPSVSLSKLTAAARQLAEAGPPVDFAKIAQIRQAIANGSYQSDAEAIADAVLRHYHSGKS
jgi:negative regulator of flagellin synthesis FlgM